MRKDERPLFNKGMEGAFKPIPGPPVHSISEGEGVRDTGYPLSPDSRGELGLFHLPPPL